MSGTNRLVNSMITMKNGSNSQLTKALENANEVVIKTKKEKKAKK